MAIKVLGLLARPWLCPFMSTKLLKLEDKGAGGGEAGQGLLGTVQEEGLALFLLF